MSAASQLLSPFSDSGLQRPTPGAAILQLSRSRRRQNRSQHGSLRPRLFQRALQRRQLLLQHPEIRQQLSGFGRTAWTAPAQSCPFQSRYSRRGLFQRSSELLQFLKQEETFTERHYTKQNTHSGVLLEPRGQLIRSVDKCVPFIGEFYQFSSQVPC